MTPLELSAGLGGWISLVLILLLIQNKPLDPLGIFITPFVVICLVYATLQTVWYSAMAFLYILTAMMNPVLVGATCTTLLVGVITYTTLDIASKIHHDPMTPRRPEEQIVEHVDEQVAEQVDEQVDEQVGKQE
jgi:predicted membrane protein